MGKFKEYQPVEILRPYVKYLVVSENEQVNDYKVLPDVSLVMGFQYKGSLALIADDTANKLSAMGITGLQDQYRVFKNSENVGSILVYFNETGASYFFRNPINELFSESLSLDNFICQSRLNQIHEQLCEAIDDAQRINIVESFLISLLRYADTDLLVTNAIQLIYQSKGNIRMKLLAEKLNISQSPLEKRFRSIVGASPKKFASIVRLQSIIKQPVTVNSLTEIAYHAGYYDQAHFIKDFKQFTGDNPLKFLVKK